MTRGVSVLGNREQGKGIMVGLLLMLLLAGCSRDAAQQTAYEALRNMERNKCQAEGTEPCPSREGYNSYQQHRKELEESQK